MIYNTKNIIRIEINMYWDYRDLQNWIQNGCDPIIEKYITELDISNYDAISEIPKIPKEIGQLINLQTFYCGENEISEIPTEIGQLINLQTFYCGENEISEIPIEITKCIQIMR